MNLHCEAETRATRMLLLFALLSLAAGTNTAGQSFLEANKVKEGVVALPSGLQYKVLKTGSGTEHPHPDTACSCHYEGRTAQQYPAGKVFDSSYARGEPTSFAPNQVIKGWTEVMSGAALLPRARPCLTPALGLWPQAMQLMVAGDKWELFIPSDLAYGESGAGDDISPGDALVFELELLSLQGAGKALTADEVKVRAARVYPGSAEKMMRGARAKRRGGKAAGKSDHEL